MNRLDHKQFNKIIRKNRVRGTVKGTSERPRLSVSISNRHVSAQIIDDTTGSTIVSSSTVGNKKIKSNTIEACTFIGEDIAKKATKAKISKVVLDRNGRAYKARLAALSDAARENGLEF